MSSKKLMIATAVCLAMASSVVAQRWDQKLEVGSDAPPLTIATWVKGDPVTLEEGRVYVVEFWATWCIPCERSIPHLTELQEQYEDEVTIIGISTEDLKLVRPFVRQKRNLMNYTVAVDEKKRTSNAYMKAAERDTIPTAFIIDRQGKILFIGNPLSDEFPVALNLIRGDRYNPDLMKKAQPLLKGAEQSRKLEDWRMMSNYYNKVIEMDPRVFNEVAKKQFRVLLNDKKKIDDALKYARGDFMTWYANDPETLSFLADEILKDKTLLENDPEELKQLALDLATAGVAAARPDDPLAASILASAYFHNGDVKTAIDIQTRAYYQASPKKKGDFKRALDTYRASLRNSIRDGG